jgi:hypothetical protein
MVGPRTERKGANASGEQQGKRTQSSNYVRRTKTMHQVIIAGDRDYLDRDHIKAEMNALWKEIGPFEVISGCARGVDTVSGNLAMDAGIPVHSYPAEWDKYGKGAGPVRNRQMLNHPATHLLAFLSPHSRGTINMVNQADRAGIEVKIINITRDEGKWAFPATS